jgi:phosphatidylglycerophosphate synthase
MLALTHWPVLDGIVTAVIVITTLISGIEYFVKNWDVLDLRR